jgi:hypothetical protein
VRPEKNSNSRKVAARKKINGGDKTAEEFLITAFMQKMIREKHERPSENQLSVRPLDRRVRSITSDPLTTSAEVVY